MIKIYSLFLLVLLFFPACDFQGSYEFKMKNETSATIRVEFLYPNYNGIMNDTVVVINPSEEKVIRIIDGALNVSAHDCLQDHGMVYFEELIFDLYVDDLKIEKQLWVAENWYYKRHSMWVASYTMIVTDELLRLDETDN